MAHILFVTHPEVVIDPATPVPDWPLSGVGIGRMRSFAEKLLDQNVVAVWSSAEQKAKDGARIVGERLGLQPGIDRDLGENDRSSTGFIAPPEFWSVVREFFAKPDQSVRGWETAMAAQARIVSAVSRVNAISPSVGVVVVVSHGGVGRLLLSRLSNLAIGQDAPPPNPGGGNYMLIDRRQLSVAQGWKDIDQTPPIYSG